MKNNLPTNFTGATFSEIKQDLIDWLSGQNEFKDYDFAGARINVLLDLLAYSTLYMQQFSNSAMMESFIRTASQRGSVVQHAQDNGYYPEKKTASTVDVFVKFKNPLNPQAITIPRGTKFNAVLNGVQDYTFVTLENSIIVRGDNNLYEEQVKLHQGRIVRTETTFDPLTPILIYDPSIDRSTVKLMVEGVPWTDWTNNSFVHTNGMSTVFYTRETIDGYTQFFFGEGVDDNTFNGSYIGGLRPLKGSRIIIEYLSTAGAEANGSKNFQYVDTLDNIEVESLEAVGQHTVNYVGSLGGGDPENIERIRELAPIYKETQRRCVTDMDYEAFVSERFGTIVQAVQCYSNSEKPGYVFISVKPLSGLTLTAIQKEDIFTYLSKYNIGTITPVISDPNYLYVSKNIKVSYRLGELAESEEWLRGKIIEGISKYYIKDVEMFNRVFSISKMLSYVDDSNTSIVGSSCDIKLVRELSNYYRAPISGVKYLNEVKEKTVISSTFAFDNGELTYPVRYASTMKEDNIAKLVVGPFKDGDIKIPEYTGNDFEKMESDYNKYYVVGEVKHADDYIYYDLGRLNKSSDDFEAAYIELYAVPLNDNIFAKDGSLIVFENDLRPHYTHINLEAIAQ